MTLTPEQIADEERRAQLWRDQAARRVAYQQGLWMRLAGSPAAHRAFMAGWWPLLEALAEAEEPGVAPEDDPEFDPLWLSDQVNVGT